MATVGQQLLSPESGWRRYDNKSDRILYTGSWGTYYNGAYYSSSLTASIQLNASFTFKFYGSKLRILDEMMNNRGVQSINIDGNISNYDAYKVSGVIQCIAFEVTGLEFTVHTVTVTLPSNSYYIGLDCIDIDDTGYLVNQNVISSFLIQDGTELKTINSGNLVTVCNATDSNTIIESAFNTSGISDLSVWNDSLTNQVTNSTFNIVAYRKYVE